MCFKAHQMIARLIYEKNLELVVRLTSKQKVLNQIYIQIIKSLLDFPGLNFGSILDETKYELEMLSNLGNSLPWHCAWQHSLKCLVCLEAGCSTTLMDPLCTCCAVAACF